MIITNLLQSLRLTAHIAAVVVVRGGGRRQSAVTGPNQHNFETPPAH